MSLQSSIVATQPPMASQHAAESTVSSVIAYKSEGNGHIQIRENRSDYRDCHKQEFSRLPQTEPVDMQFENISYTASLGFRKGKALYDFICTVHVVRSLNLLTPTHAQLHFIKQPFKKTPTCFGLRPSSGSYKILAKVTII